MIERETERNIPSHTFSHFFLSQGLRSWPQHVNTYRIDLFSLNVETLVVACWEIEVVHQINESESEFE